MMRLQGVKGSRAAVELLEATGQAQARAQTTAGDNAGDTQSLTVTALQIDFLVIPTEKEGVWFDRLVDAIYLDKNLEFIRLYRGVFDQTSNAVERLFREVLPNHPSLKEIVLNSCRIKPEYAEFFTEAVTKREHSLPSLTFSATMLEEKGTAAFVNLIKANVPMKTLILSNCGIGSEGCPAIFEAVGQNTHLRHLTVSYGRFNQISLEAVQALQKSNLQSLHLNDGVLSPEFLKTLLQGLKTNTKLDTLDVSGSRRVSSQPFEEFLTSFNFTLRTLQVDFCVPSPDQERVDFLLRRNDRVYNTHHGLRHCYSYHLPELALWPEAISNISSKPSLLYEFVRRGNAATFAKLMQNTNYHSSTRAEF